MPSLVRLELAVTAVTDAGLKDLSGHPGLQYLNLSGTSITDAGLRHLSDMPHLRELWIAQTRVTPAGVAEFRAANPAVTVHDVSRRRTTATKPARAGR